MRQTDASAPRRQARGERRIEQILDAAESVFAEAGFEGATTNAIAQRAHISPGSLYQFFRNKEQIAHSLAERYVAQLTEAQSAAVGPTDAPTETLDAFLARAVGNMVAFNVTNPGFLALFARTDMQPALRDAIAPLQESLSARVSAFLTAYAPHKSKSDIALYTLVALQIARGVMPVIAAARGAKRRALAEELETALRCYLTHVLE